MVAHLAQKAVFLERLSDLRTSDTVLDIGSNDATLLSSYSVPAIQKIGIDPTGRKFQRYYSEDIKLIPEFFSSDIYLTATSSPAKIVTSIAMFYDLEQPTAFAKQVASILAPDGIWHFEQSYMPSMLRMNSYDTICHEHLEYYSLDVVLRILDAAGLEPIDAVMNSINGGSFAVTAAHKANTNLPRNRPVVDWLLDQEDRMGLHTTTIPRVRRAGLSAPSRPHPSHPRTARRPQDRPRLRSLNEGQRGTTVLRPRPG
jgi:hypothetical protein